VPTSYQIDPVQQLVRCRAWGVISNADPRDHYHSLVADPRFRASFRHLVDLQAVTEFTLESWMIAEVASWPVFDAGTRRAIVAETDVAFGLSRMFSLMAERVGQLVRVFRGLEDAEEWLDSPMEPGREPDISPSPRPARVGAA
jgi:hypothetical protein